MGENIQQIRLESEVDETIQVTDSVKCHCLRCKKKKCVRSQTSDTTITDIREG